MALTLRSSRSGDANIGRSDDSATLAGEAPGSTVLVEQVLSGHDPAAARRLLALGFTPGSEVEVIRRAPLGDPVVYRVKDYEVCLRRAQARQIRVTGTA